MPENDHSLSQNVPEPYREIYEEMFHKRATKDLPERVEYIFVIPASEFAALWFFRDYEAYHGTDECEILGARQHHFENVCIGTAVTVKTTGAIKAEILAELEQRRVPVAISSEDSYAPLNIQQPPV